MELQKLTHFFNKRIYKIPDYQRGYSWGENQILDLLTDIRHAIKLDSLHYTGTITIHPQKKKEKIGLNNYEVYHIVDGQQRITTLILILSFLIKELKKDEEFSKDAIEKEQTYIINKGSYLFRYAIDTVSETFFRSLILEKESLNSLEENIYTRKLAVAKKTIKEYFNQSEHKDKIVDYLNAIEEKLQFNEYVISTTSQIGVVFETMNNRGVQLSNIEIVKNRLLYLTSKINIGEENESDLINLSNDINTKWATILKNLTLTNSVLSEDTFLNNHWIIYHGWSKDNQAKQSILGEEFTIERMVENQEAMVSKIKHYIKSLATASLHWRFINYPEEDRAFTEVEDRIIRDSLKLYFGKLNRLSNSTVRPLLLSMMPLMNSSPSTLLELVKLAEVFSFRLFSMNKRRSDTGKSDIYRKCRMFHDECQNQEVQKKAFCLLAWYIKLYGDEDRFKLEVQEMFNSSKKSGYYSWAGLAYFLYEYEESKRGIEDIKFDYKYATKISDSVEHILPQTTKGTKWDELLNEHKEASKRKRVLHSLGNLVMIKASKNSSMRNAEYEIKIQHFKTGSFSENEIAMNNEEWNPDRILQREKGLIDFLENRWQLDSTYKECLESEAEIEDDYENEDLE